MSCRRYIPLETTTQAFLISLQRRAIKHAVLRWFEDLPAVEPGEDIDILVADEDAPRLLTLVEASGTGQPLDVYSVSGTHNLRFRRAPYFPPAKARELLSRRVKGPVCDHPCPEDHWASLAYHAVWHKRTIDSDDHDYRAALGLTHHTRLEALAARLELMGWHPSPLTRWRWRHHLRSNSGSIPATAKAGSNLPHSAAKAGG
jgi:hypothetical protein